MPAFLILRGFIIMETLNWNKKSFMINGKPGFLISGEFHYFRVPKEAWRTRLQLLKGAGMNCVATLVPWVIHEPVEGSFVFGDVPERDLEGFLKLCNEMQLYVLCRPGPYQYSEMYHGGLPGWLSENYPELGAIIDRLSKTFRSRRPMAAPTPDSLLL